MYDPNFTQPPAPKRSIWKMKRTYAGGFAALVILGAITNGGKNDTTSDAKTPDPAVTVTVTPSPSATSAEDALKDIQASNSAAQKDLKDKIAEASKSAKAAAEDSASQTGEVPDVVGMNHDAALSVLHNAGFLVNEEDANGSRWIIDNSNWKVCRQSPGPGNHPATIRVAIYSVKLDESC